MQAFTRQSGMETLHVLPVTVPHVFIHERTEPYNCLCLPSQSWSSFTNPRRDGGRVGLNSLSRTVTRQISQLLAVEAVTPHWATVSHFVWYSWYHELRDDSYRRTRRQTPSENGSVNMMTSHDMTVNMMPQQLLLSARITGPPPTQLHTHDSDVPTTSKQTSCQSNLVKAASKLPPNKMFLRSPKSLQPSCEYILPITDCTCCQWLCDT